MYSSPHTQIHATPHATARRAGGGASVSPDEIQGAHAAFGVHPANDHFHALDAVVAAMVDLKDVQPCDEVIR